MQRLSLRLFLPCVLTATAYLISAWLLAPRPADAGFKLYKAKEAETTFVSGGQNVKVWSFTPAEGVGPFPAIVSLYGLDGLDMLEKDKSIQLLYKTVGGRIADKGFVVHMVHYFNRTPFQPNDIEPLKQALLTGVPKMKTQPLDPKLEKLYKEWLIAAKDGIEAVRQRKDVDKEKIGIVGLSMGGFIGASLVVDNPDLKISALVNVFGGLPPQQYAAAKASKNLPPLLVIGGEQDEIVPVQFQRELYGLWCEAGATREAHFYGDVGHAFIDKERGAIDMDLALNEALTLASRFLKRHVQGLKVEKK